MPKRADIVAEKELAASGKPPMRMKRPPPSFYEQFKPLDTTHRDSEIHKAQLAK